MPKIRGDFARQSFVKKNEIVCTSHSILMFGQEKDCVCGSKITEDYYTFAYREQNSKEEFLLMHAGPECGKKIIDIAGIYSPPLTNPFTGDVAVENAMNRVQNNNINETQMRLITRRNREMLQAVSVLFGIWGGPREGFIQRGLMEIMGNPTIDIPPQFIRSLNKVAYVTLHNDVRLDEHLSMRENFIQLAADHGRHARNLRFDRLQEALKSKYPEENFYL